MNRENNPVMAEAMTMLKVFKQAIEIGVKNIFFETDNLSVVKAFNDQDLRRTGCGLICNQIRKKWGAFIKVRIYQIGKEREQFSTLFC